MARMTDTPSDPATASVTRWSANKQVVDQSRHLALAGQRQIARRVFLRVVPLVPVPGAPRAVGSRAVARPEHGAVLIQVLAVGVMQDARLRGAGLQRAEALSRPQAEGVVVGSKGKGGIPAGGLRFRHNLYPSLGPADISRVWQSWVLQRVDTMRLAQHAGAPLGAPDQSESRRSRCGPGMIGKW